MLLPGSQPLSLSLGVIAIAPLLVSCSYTHCLLSILNTGAARVTPTKLVRPCYKPTQNPAIIPHLSQNKSQYPDSGSLVLINTLTTALPLVHSVSFSLASLFHRKCIWLRTLVGTVSSAYKILPQKTVRLISLSPMSLSSNITSQ